MADNRISGKIEYGFREALQKLADSMKDASAIVGKWKDICTSDQPTTTLTMSTGTYEVMTLAGIKESLNAWMDKATGTLVRSHFKAEVTGSHYANLGGSYLTFANRKPNQKGGGKIPSYRSLGAFADVADTYRLSYVDDTDRFTSMFVLPKVLVISLGIKTTTVDGAQVHKVAIRSTEVGHLPYHREDTPAAPLATEFFIHNDLMNAVTIEFYSGADYSQKVASIAVPAHVPGRLRTAVHLLCIGHIGAPVSISRAV